MKREFGVAECLHRANHLTRATPDQFSQMRRRVCFSFGASDRINLRSYLSRQDRPETITKDGRTCAPMGWPNRHCQTHCTLILIGIRSHGLGGKWLIAIKRTVVSIWFFKLQFIGGNSVVFAASGTVLVRIRNPVLRVQMLSHALHLL